MNFDIQRDAIDALFAGVVEDKGDPRAAVLGALRSDGLDLSPIRCAWLLAGGEQEAHAAIARVLARLDPEGAENRRREIARGLVDRVLAADVQVSGGEAVAVTLMVSGVEQVYAYGGTSELPTCDAVEKLPAPALINGRGDKESAFMAAGASLLRPNRGAAILHGARGLTNAGGALADARRNEAGTVFIVGMPSTGSSRFLPPHGEEGLIPAMGHFARWDWEAPVVPAAAPQRSTAAITFMEKLREAVGVAGTAPHGPVLFGLPQDVAEAAWIPVRALARAAPPSTDGALALDAALRHIRSARRPLVLIDDYALRIPGIREGLNAFAAAIGAPIVQLRYRRGLMLFERLQVEEVPNFAGWLNPFSDEHRQMLSDCDLLVTVEDRNIYQRVVGDLPTCPKIAINTDPSKVLKNEYLAEDDVLVVGDGAEVLLSLAEQLGTSRSPAWPLDELRSGSLANPEPPSQAVAEGRSLVASAVSRVLQSRPHPVIVDDSSMFGGLLTEHYDDLPAGLRVFGGHAGFVGAGLPYAVGLAIGAPDHNVVCVLGDQAFTNSHQALVAAVQERADLVILVCNNGESVSLKKQARASYGDRPRRYLDNAAGLDYCRLASAVGVPAERVTVPVGKPVEEVAEAANDLSSALERAAAMNGPALVELVLPSDPDAWRGIWVTQGFEQSAPVSSR